MKKISVIIFIIFNFIVYSEENKKVVLQLKWKPQFQFAGYYTALWKGFYEEAGLDVEIRSGFDSSGERISAMEEVLSKKADFGVGTQEILAAYSDGEDIKVIAVIFQNSPVAFYLKKEIKFNSLIDIKNIKVPYEKSRYRGVEFEATLLKEGLSSTDFKIVRERPYLENLLSGKIDLAKGYVTTIPYIAKKKGVELREIRASDYGINFYGDTLYVNGDFLKNSSKKAEAFLEATKKGWLYALENREEIIEQLAEVMEDNRTVEERKEFLHFEAEKTAEIMMYPIVEIGHINPDRFKVMYGYMEQLGMVEKEFVAEELIYDFNEEKVKKEKRVQKIFITFGRLIAIVVIILIIFIIVLWKSVKYKTRKLNEELIEREKLEEKLVEEKNKADKANKAKSQFLANMSHEIRTPMNGIIGMLEILRFTDPTEEQKKFLDNIEIASESLLSIINDILDISKIEAGKLDIEKQEFNLEELIEKTIDSLALTAHRKHVELVSYIDPLIPEFLEGDEGKLRQILINILGNAVKFTDSGHVFLKVSIIREENERIQLQFFIEDTGIGIDDEKQKVIFTPFIQGDLSYTKKYQGTGLGLSISKRLVDLLGGELTFKSKEGMGTVFNIKLSFELSKRVVHNVKKMKLNLKKLRVLLIDDNSLNRDIVEKMLSYEGVIVKMASSGQEGIDILKDDKEFHVVLLDVNMPEMDGFMVAETLNRIIDTEKIAVVMFTSVDIRDQLGKIKELGVSNYLMKPVKRRELMTKLEEAVNCLEAKRIEKEIKNIDRINLQKINRRVLLVEDNEVNVIGTKIILEKRGIEVLIANDGQEAVDVLEKEEVDLILMDIQMPIMNGIEATKLIRSGTTVNRNKPIIALTAYAMSDDRKNIIEAGMDYMVVKPAKMSELNRVIDKYLEES